MASSLDECKELVAGCQQFTNALRIFSSFFAGKNFSNALDIATNEEKQFINTFLKVIKKHKIAINGKYRILK